MTTYLDEDLENLKKMSREYILELSCWWCRWRNGYRCYNEKDPKFSRKKDGKSTLIIANRTVRNCKNFESIQYNKIKGFGYSPLSMREQKLIRKRLIKPIQPENLKNEINMILDNTRLKSLYEKKIGDVITEETKILTEFRDGYEVRESIFEKEWLFKTTHENLTVWTDMRNNVVICFKDNKPVCLFGLYEIHNTFLNGKRGLVIVEGHETIHEYWFDDGEYNEHQTK